MENGQSTKRLTVSALGERVATLEEQQKKGEAIWLTITNVRLTAKSTEAAIEVEVQGDAGEAADGGPSWLKCREIGASIEGAEKLYDKILEALQNNRKVRGKLVSDDKKLVIEEVQVQYQ